MGTFAARNQDGTYYMNCQPGTCTDGTLVAPLTDCPEYANVQPWVPNGGPYQDLRTVPAGASRLAWRYLTKYAHGGQRYYMVRDTAIAVTAAGFALGASPASADCCMGGPDLPIAFHSTFPRPVALGASVRGTVRSDGPARYVAKARVNVGPRTVVRLRPIARTSGVTASRLVLRFTVAQRRAIAAAAHRRHVAPVLYVRLKGTVDGQSGDRYGFDHFTVSLKRSAPPR